MPARKPAKKKAVRPDGVGPQWAPNVGNWMDKSCKFFKERGVSEDSANSDLIMAAVLGCRRGQLRLWSTRNISDKQGRRFWSLVEQRGQRLPLGYVLGVQNFMGLDMAVNPKVLIPRPETEELVEEAQKRLKALGRPAPVVLEIGTGSGCVAVALAKNVPGITVYATEVSSAALALALKNAETHGVSRRIRFLKEDLFKPAAKAAGWADMVVSNPPYIPSGAIDGLDPEVLNEPRLALDGGKDGLDAIRAIAASAPRHIKKDGFLLLEIGSNQGPAALAILKKAGGRDVAVRKDMQGLDRIAVARF